ncbi:MAG: NapC/NirT family cytochrome c [Ignavibacteriales bacterium]|nr:NapC/NirT family cytochrome c [Ignavibacteriales bacterium]
MKRFFPPAFYNMRTLIGAAIASVSFGLVLFLTVLDLFAGEQKPYVGILTFIILPIFILFGLGLVFYGTWREHRREKRGLPHELKLPRIDLNDPRQRNAFFWISLGGLMLLIFSAFGSFKAYEYTDSDKFCGTMCHTVMSPEYTAYEFSPHARVGCVKCHIGPGAGWFVRAKLSGAYQVYATLFNKYPKPIPTPIENLRPAQETCEQCHWPKHFFSEKMLKNTYFLSDEKNTRWMLDLLIKIGGGNIEAGPTSGIHWHMNIANELTYIATDSQRQSIPWIRSKNPEGKVVVYQSTENSLTDEQIRTMKTRRMDCIDCHNRPTHIYHPPARSINHVMSLGWIDPNLPNVKSVSLKALENSYSTKQIGLDSIQLAIEGYYQMNYPELAKTKQDTIAKVISEVQKIFSRNYFPEMHVSWKKFPDNIGHMYYPGCFRCHDGKHVSGDGKVLSRDCNVCHTILAQQFEKEGLRLSLSGVEYRHPVDIGNAWKEMNCSDCHNAQ